MRTHHSKPITKTCDHWAKIPLRKVKSWKHQYDRKPKHYSQKQMIFSSSQAYSRQLQIGSWSFDLKIQSIALRRSGKIKRKRRKKQILCWANRDALG